MLNRIKLTVICAVALFLISSCGAKRKVASVGKPSADRQTGKVSTIPNKMTSGHNLAYYADLLGSRTKDMNASLYTYIDSWMGIPHRMGGATKDGVDCSGFVGMIYTEVYRKNLPRTSRDMAAIVKRKYDDQLKEGDLVFFSFGGRDIDHVGIYLHNDMFVHVSTKRGVMISNLKENWYYKYLTRCGTP